MMTMKTAWLYNYDDLDFSFSSPSAPDFSPIGSESTADEDTPQDESTLQDKLDGSAVQDINTPQNVDNQPEV